MKRNVILAVVVIAALALAGTGGVFATWSDSETSMSNIIETGAVDLKVNGADDAPWGTGVPSKVDITCMIPCKWYGGYEVELWHAGQCTQPAHAYINFKDVCCGNVPPKINPYDPEENPDEGSECWYDIYGPDATTGYPAPDQDPRAGELKPEPELVAEWGGKVDCLTVPGVGNVGDGCSMKSTIEVAVTAVDADEFDDIADDDIIIGPMLIGDLEGEETYLFDLIPCNARVIYLWFHLVQESEEDYGYDFFADPGEEGFNELRWLKFNDWPSWAVMKDQVSFSMEFDLWLEDP
jgi:predicted ribosomally synthesized peptide with SipW-like signal peptide